MKAFASLALVLAGCGYYRHVSPGEFMLAGPLQSALLEEARRTHFDPPPADFEPHPGRLDAPEEDAGTAPAPRSFDSVLALASLHAIDLVPCHAHVRVHARVTFDGSGAVARVAIDTPAKLDPSVVECLTHEISTARVQPFDGAPMTAGVGWSAP